MVAKKTADKQLQATQQTGVRLPVALLRKARMEAASRGVPLATIATEALEAYFSKGSK